MPQRFLRPGIVTSVRLARCSPWAQLLYYKLINLVDDFSRYDAHPLALGRAAFPYGDNRGRMFRDEQIEAMLAELETARLSETDDPCLTRYTARGARYLFLHRWTERTRAANSRYPSPSEDAACWQMLSDVVRRQQMFAPTPSTSPSAPTSPSSSNGREERGDVRKSKAQFAAIQGDIQKLEAIPEEERKDSEHAALALQRRRLKKLQKKQAAGDFTTVGEHET